MDEPRDDLLLCLTGDRDGSGWPEDIIATAAAMAAVRVKSGWPETEDIHRGRYLGLWERDIIPAAGILTTIIDFLDRHPEVGIAAPALFCRQQRLPTFGRPPSFFRIMATSRIELSPPPGRDEVEVAAISVPAVIMRPEMIDETGLPRSGPGGIAALCRRGRRRGWHHFALPRARAEVKGDPARLFPEHGLIDLCLYFTGR